MLDRYLEDPKIERKRELDVLAFWKENAGKYKELSLLARDILSIPLTTVASESSFSIGGRILNKWKSSYIPENVEALITTRSWLYGFDCKCCVFIFKNYFIIFIHLTFNLIVIYGCGSNFSP